MKKFVKSIVFLIIYLSFTNISFSQESPKDENIDPNGIVKPVTGYYEMKSPFITNLSSNGNKLNYVKASVVIVLNDSRDIPLLEEHDPLLRDAIITILGTTTYSEISRNNGRAKLLEDCKKKITELTDEAIGRRIIKNVMFTEFITQ
jgi:flagellar protein FliL